MSEREDSVSSQPESREGLECKKRLKKSRSVRLLRVSSMRSSARREKPQYDDLSKLSSVGTESSGRSTPIEKSDASPNYMKATSSSHAKESFQGSRSRRLFTKKTLTRMSSMNLKRSLTRKLSAETEQKRKLKSSRSIKLATVKVLRSTGQVKSQRKKGSLNSESINGSNGQNRSPSHIQPYLIYAGNKSQKVITRRLSFKPVRILKKMSSFKSNKSSMEKGPQISQSPDSSLHKATCSSTLKDSHFPDHIDLPQDGRGSHGVSARKICPYTYCSLHGGHHDNLPPLKRFVSMKRRLLKTQKSMKMESLAVSRSKDSGKRRNTTQKSQTIHREDHVNKTAHSGRPHFHNGKRLARDSNVMPHDTPVSTLTVVGTSGEDDEEKDNFRYNAEVLLGETSFPHITFEKYLSNSLAEKGHSLFSFLAIKETNMECCCIASEKDKSDSKVTERAGNDKNIATCKKNDESAVVISTSTTAVTSSASDIEIMEGEITTKGKNMEPDNEVLQVRSPQKESKPTCTTDVACGMQYKDNKYIKMWHLIYKQAVLSNTGKGENKLPFDGKGMEGRGQGALLFNRVNSSCQDYCETDQHMDEETNNVIELVQKAFDEILQPEAEHLSSDDHLSRCIGSNEELLEKSEGKRGEMNASASKESPKESWLEVDRFRSHEEETTAQEMGTKPDQKTPKGWSKMKKLILLKRFVKALEKVRNFNLCRHGHFPTDANLEAEKVYLRHQTAEEKKNAEEWMLDYALQKVISKLAPPQKQRVALLVEAFETILPFQDAGNGRQPFATVETQANSVQSHDDSSDHSKEKTDRERDYGYSAQLLLEKASCYDNGIRKYAENASNNPMPEQQNPIVFKELCLDYPWTETVENIPASGAFDEDLNGEQNLARSYVNGEKSSIVNDNIYLAEIKDSRSLSFSKTVDIISSCLEETPTNEIVNEVPQDSIYNLNTEISNSKSESPETEFETKNLIGAKGKQFSLPKSLTVKGLVRSLGSNWVSSAAPSDLLDEPTADTKERIEKAKLEAGTLEGFPLHEESEAPKSAIVEPETQLEKQDYTGLWYLVYKHMVSGIAATDSTLLIDGADEKESLYDGSRTRGTSISYESTPVMNKYMHFKDHGVADPEVELQQIEAIKMVEGAIDAVLPDVQDDLPDGQSLTGSDNTIQDNCQKTNEREREDNEDLNQKEERVASGNGITQEQEELVPKKGNKQNQKLPRSWSNLKKVILLRRFIKALEGVKKFNPREPRYLPMDPDSEAEKVHLRHQDMAERKGTEEWMLDHALRQVVAKLNTARKRKVELLVEAFETVMPTIKT